MEFLINDCKSLLRRKNSLTNRRERFFVFCSPSVEHYDTRDSRTSQQYIIYSDSCPLYRCVRVYFVFSCGRERERERERETIEHRRDPVFFFRVKIDTP